jgi:hypothetical protein
MKLLTLATLLTAGLLVVSCGPKTDKKEAPAAQQTVKIKPLPDGYPAELTIPEGFTTNDISVGDGSSSGGGKGVRTFATYRIEKVMAGDKTSLVEHYKMILAENNWKGEMKSPEAGYGYGTFTKGNMELELKMNDMVFSFDLRAYNN